MARRTKRPPITRTLRLESISRSCSSCGGTLWAGYESVGGIRRVPERTIGAPIRDRAGRVHHAGTRRDARAWPANLFRGLGRRIPPHNRRGWPVS